jgi:hypothetical protein
MAGQQGMLDAEIVKPATNPQGFISRFRPEPMVDYQRQNTP